LSSESSFDSDFDDLSSLFVGLVPDLANRVLTGVPGVRDDGRYDSSASFERLTIFFSDVEHKIVSFELYPNYGVSCWHPPNCWTYFRMKECKHAGKRHIMWEKIDDRNELCSSYRWIRIF
jgi:hypothetical protein